MVNIKKYYECLGLNEGASIREITLAYNSIIKSDNLTQKKKLELEEAYEELSRLKKIPREDSRVLYELSGDLFDDTFEDLASIMKSIAFRRPVENSANNRSENSQTSESIENILAKNE